MVVARNESNCVMINVAGNVDCMDIQKVSVVSWTGAHFGKTLMHAGSCPTLITQPEIRSYTVLSYADILLHS